MAERKARVTDPPARIFLCIGDLMGDDVDFHRVSREGEVTWCTEQQEDTDVEYRLVRPSRHRKRGGLPTEGQSKCTP
jgi:hypothetical protein